MSRLKADAGFVIASEVDLLEARCCATRVVNESRSWFVTVAIKTDSGAGELGRKQRMYSGGCVEKSGLLERGSGSPDSGRQSSMNEGRRASGCLGRLSLSSGLWGQKSVAGDDEVEPREGVGDVDGRGRRGRRRDTRGGRASLCRASAPINLFPGAKQTPGSSRVVWGRARAAANHCACFDASAGTKLNDAACCPLRPSRKFTIDQACAPIKCSQICRDRQCVFFKLQSTSSKTPARAQLLDHPVAQPLLSAAACCTTITGAVNSSASRGQLRPCFVPTSRAGIPLFHAA